MLTDQELIDKLNYFRGLTSEKEWFEFKDANDNFKTDKIGEYFSALSNEANLLEKDFAWLIFGVHNKTHKIIGTDYRIKTERLHGLKKQIADNITDRISFVNIYVITVEGKQSYYVSNSAGTERNAISMERTLVWTRTRKSCTIEPI